jgi:two-component system CheB/CheR fusion protein
MADRKSSSKAPAGSAPKNKPDESLETEAVVNPASGECLIVGVGASAGGVEAFSALLRQTPEDPQIAFVLISHLDPHHESILAQLLANQTPMPVVQVRNDIAVECNHVYVIPPNQEMVISGGTLKLQPRAEGVHRHMPIDTFFRSLAEARGAKGIGVVLSGNASDGTLGLKAIKTAGGITFAQDETAKFDSMPRTAITAGVVDFVLPPEAIARELVRLARHPYLAPSSDAATGGIEERGLSRILEILRASMGVDFSQYKRPTIQRRTMRRMALHKIDSPEAYVQYMRLHPEELEGLCNDLLINVTEFFRDAGTFEGLKQIAFPKILKDRAEVDPIRVWVPACSTGEEVYSIAMALIEYLEDMRLHYDLQLFGTDVSEVAIGKARAGVYPKSVTSALSPERIRRFFVRVDSGYQIGRQIRDSCVFSRQDVMKDPPLSRMDLVSCRNLLIYLSPAMQSRVGAVLHYALKPTGCLLLGSSESLGSMGKYFSTLDKQHKIYCRNIAAGEPPLDLPPRISIHHAAMHQPANPARTAMPQESAGIIKHYVDRHLSDYLPRALVVDEQWRIVEARGNLQPILSSQAGEDVAVVEAIKEELAEPLREAILETRRDEMPVQRQGLKFQANGQRQLVDIRVLPISVPQQPAHCLIVFENMRAEDRGDGGYDKAPTKADTAETVQHLEQRLLSSRQYLQTVIEELRSANEEAQSTNEELQSTNEELQTAKEELQASNEELRTINDEMQSRNADLSRAHNDLTNLLSSMNLPVIMLDNELRIRRFTPISEKILHLIASDVGRPIEDLKLRINVPDIESLVRQVIGTPTVYEREVQDEEGRWYAMRIRPYRTTENRIEGAVLQLVDMDEIKRGVDRVKRARDYAEAIVNTVREPLVVLHEGGRIRTANASFYQTFGLTPEQAAGQLIFEVAEGKLNLPELRELLNKAAGKRDELQEIEIECEVRNLGRRTMVVNARAIQPDEQSDLILLAFEDITERKQEAEARYRRLFEAAKDGILLADAESGEIADMNPFAEQLLGFARGEIVGRKLWEIEALSEVPELQEAISRIREEGVVRFPDVPIWTKSARLIQSEVIGNVYTEKKGRVIQFNIRDISERRKFFRQIQESQKLESLGLLAGGIAHDFNNLLTGIIGNVSLVLSETVDQRSRVCLRDAIRASEQAAHLTRQILAYAGKGQFVREPLNLSELIAEIHPLIQSSVPKSVNMQFDLMEDPPAVEADRSQMQQLIMNLVINGAEAIPESQGGAVVVRTAIRDITQDDIRDTFVNDEITPGRYLMLEVKDTGAGMDEATKAKIFDPFFTTKFSGRGLGLAATLGIVKSHRGAVRVHSTPGHGTSFTVLLPVTAKEAQQAPEEAAQAELGGDGATILLIDDDPLVRKVAERGLARYGYKIVVADTGETGVRLLQENRGKISLIVLDLTMPGLGGEETLRLLKEIRPDAPIILSSGYEELDARQRFRQNDLAGFLQKPYTVQRLLLQIKSVLALHDN